MRGKPFLCLLFLYATFMPAAEAQRSTSEGNFQGGLRGGIAASQISGDDLSGFHKLGGEIGLYADFPLSDNLRWKIQLELDFVMKGSHSFAAGKQHVDKYVLNLGCLEMPVLIKWLFAGRWELELGPSLGVLLYARERNANGLITHRPPFRRMELGAVGGVNCHVGEHLSFGLRYSNSVLPVRIPTWAVNRRIKKQYNSVLAVCAGYRF